MEELNVVYRLQRHIKQSIEDINISLGKKSILFIRCDPTEGLKKISERFGINPLKLPFSYRILIENLVRCSENDEFIEKVLKNIKSICEAAGNSLEDIVKITIFLTDLDNFATVNEVMKEHFSEPYPARATIEVSGLPLGVNVEIEAIVSTNG